MNALRSCLLPATVLLAAGLAAGCATSRDGRQGNIADAELLRGAPLMGTAAPPISGDTAATLAVSDEMKHFVARYVDRGADRYARLRQLTQAVLSPGTFGLDYDETTHTAAETFASGRGNCLSFTNLFVALAREAGLDVHFQEVDIPPDWTSDSDAWVLNRHVNVYVDLGQAGEHVVDFNLDSFRATYQRRTISDARALAHYHNNLGVGKMLAGDVPAALGRYRAALQLDRDFAPAWVNLGALYSRSGHDAFAEAAWLRALATDPGSDIAMSNLARLYERTGRDDEAMAYRRRVVAHRQRNPFYRHELARAAYEAGEFAAALDHLRYAMRMQPREHRFHRLAGLAWLGLGERDEARAAFERAEALAADDGDRRHYRRKLELLRQAAIPPPG